MSLQTKKGALLLEYSTLFVVAFGSGLDHLLLVLAAALASWHSVTTLLASHHFSILLHVATALRTNYAVLLHCLFVHSHKLFIVIEPSPSYYTPKQPQRYTRWSFVLKVINY